MDRETSKAMTEWHLTIKGETFTGDTATILALLDEKPNAKCELKSANTELHGHAWVLAIIIRNAR